MATTLETAIAQVRSFSDRICETQVYYFDDYDPASGDATALCNRLGIPTTDEIVIQFPAGRTFKPISTSRISALAKRLNASLPTDYISLLAEFGDFHLPGSSDIALFSPESIISTTCQNWGFENPSTMPVLAISNYNHHCDGDDIGFLRSGESFDRDVYVFKHELRYQGDEPRLWTERIAPSLSEFIISYLDSLP